MNDPLVNVWIIADTDGTILSAHCLGCKAGLTESCSHVASAMFYIECWTRVNGKMACMQVKCAWLLPTYVSKVSYKRVRNIDFSSAKKLKENLDTQIDSLNTVISCHEGQQSNVTTSTAIPSHSISEAEMDSFYEEPNKCETKASVLSLIDLYAEQFVAKSRNVPVISDLYDPSNLDLDYAELLEKCKEPNMMRASLARHIGAKVTKSSKTALQADGRTPLTIVGETRLPLICHGRSLTLGALVGKDLNVGTLAGTPFMTSKDITVCPTKCEIIITGCEWYPMVVPKVLRCTTLSELATSFVP